MVIFFVCVARVCFWFTYDDTDFLVVLAVGKDKILWTMSVP